MVITSLHHFHCRLLNTRRYKHLLANIFRIADENLAFQRERDGIKNFNSLGIDIDLVFESRDNMWRFESALLRVVGSTTSNKRPRFIAESEKSDYEEASEMINDDKGVAITVGLNIYSGSGSSYSSVCSSLPA